MTRATSLSETSEKRTWLLVLPLVPALGLGYQFCAEVLARAVAGHPFGLEWLAIALSQPWLVLLVVLEIGSLVAWLYVLARAPVSVAFPLTACGYGLVILMGWVAFGEPVRAMEVLGALLIGAGVLLLAGEKEKRG